MQCWCFTLPNVYTDEYITLNKTFFLVYKKIFKQHFCKLCDSWTLNRITPLTVIHVILLVNLKGLFTANFEWHSRKKDSRWLSWFQLELDQQTASQEELGPADIQPAACRHGGWAPVITNVALKQRNFPQKKTLPQTSSLLIVSPRKCNSSTLWRAAELLCTDQRLQKMHPFPARPVWVSLSVPCPSSLWQTEPSKPKKTISTLLNNVKSTEVNSSMLLFFFINIHRLILIIQTTKNFQIFKILLDMKLLWALEMCCTSRCIGKYFLFMYFSQNTSPTIYLKKSIISSKKGFY